MSISEAPKKAATQPTAASATGRGFRGALRSAGGASWKVSNDSSSAAPAMPATTQNSGRQPFAWAWTPPTSGPSATAPKMQTFRIIAVQRNLDTGKPRASGGTAAISGRLVQSPWSACPAMKNPTLGADAANTEPNTRTAA